jgi:nucleoid-associated protein YgaU
MMGMGNEAKIGVGVILGLFVILCVVLAVRISGEKAKAVAAVAAANAADPAVKDTNAGDRAAPRLLNPSQPTIVSASGTSTVVLKAPVSDGGWNLASDRPWRGGSSDTSATTPPSLMPNPQTSTVSSVVLTTTDGAAPTTIPAAASETVANATPTVPAVPAPPPAEAMTSISSSLTAPVAASPAPAATAFSPAIPPVAPPSSTLADPYRRSSSRAATSNGWGSIPAPPAVGASPTSTSASDLNSPPPSYPSSSAYASSPSSAGAGMPTYRQNRYGYGSQSDPVLSAAPASPGSNTIPDATSMSSSAIAAGPGPSPVRRDDGTYKVRPNDNFWTISEKLYGTGAYFKALAEANRDRSSRDDHLRVGTVLQAPAAEELEKNYPDLCPKSNHRRQGGGLRTVSVSTMQGMGRRVYTVEQGDTLMDIARRQLGKKSRWAEIYELNRDKLGEDHDFLRAGMQLALPEPSAAPGGRGDSVAERPGLDYRR